MTIEGNNAHTGFLRRSLVYVMLNGFSSVIELGFSGITVRLPGDGYSTLWALLKIFFIVTTPLAAFQFIVSKETAAFGVRGEFGKRRYFFVRSLQFSMVFALLIIVAGMPLSGFIANALNMNTVIPVILLFLTIGCYFPIPVFHGAVQGLKKFTTFGLMQMSWGFMRVLLGAVVVFVFSGGTVSFMAAITVATLAAAVLCFFPTRTIFHHPVQVVKRSEMRHAYGLVIPFILTFFSVTVMKNVDVVLAKGYFDHGIADAYTCAATVGSGYFVLSAIFLVMFPMVSEERARGGNPIMFLLKSCLFFIFFASAGIVISMAVPEIPMYIFTLGKRVPGAVPLIRLIGFAIIPIALINIMSNYFLAKHQWRFITILVGGMMLQVATIVFFHSTPVDMILGIIGANTATLIAMTVYLYFEHKTFIAESSRTLKTL